MSRETAATNESHFTVLGFTTATGEPIMCALILEGKVMHPEVITGMGLFATKEGDENDPDIVIKNTGKGKMLVLKLTKLLLFSAQHGRNPLLKQSFIRKQLLLEGGAHRHVTY